MQRPTLARWVRRIVGGSLLLITVFLATLWILVRASLPTLDGNVASSGATPGSGPVQLSRDALGVLTVSAATMADAARGLGFAHAQDRYFQMDLSRRVAAGELGELVGKRALDQDRHARVFGFRALARQVLAAATPRERDVIAAYARGVNAGLESLHSRPWEYWLLRVRPQPWADEDCVLVLYSMWWQLQYDDLARERGRLELTARLRELAAARPDSDEHGVDDVVRFLYARGTEWDAPNFATRADAAAAGAPQPPSLPAPERLNLRDLPANDVASIRANKSNTFSAARASPGSNNWAVDGAHSASGSALVANDMHLGLRVPPTWYRARIRVSGENLDLNGVTLPGTASLVAGSNGYIAWGFTNSYGDSSDLVIVSCELDKNSYDTDSGPHQFERHEERIAVKGAESVPLIVRKTPLGLLYASSDSGHRCLLARWLATNPEATNLHLLAFEAARDVQQALQLAPQVGIPQQNLIVGDRAGHIAWTLIGRIPLQAAGPPAAPPLTWRDAATQPHIVDPEVGRLWSANARVVDGDAELALGHDEAVIGAGYALGARAGQIRDDLLGLTAPATPKDMLGIQLDDRARYLERWRKLLLGLLDADAVRNMPQRAELRQLAEHWDARAAADSVGYRVVRAFHQQTERATFGMIVHALRLKPEVVSEPAQFEGALWRLATEQPIHLLAREYASWRAFLLAQIDATVESLREDCVQLSRCSWGQQNRLRIRHPLSQELGPLARLLDMPEMPMSGDHDMPRVQGPSFGASERFAVSPGHESEAYLELPGGQSGHPMSPYYRAGFDAWLRGEPTPFLPGSTEHTLSLGIGSPHD